MDRSGAISNELAGESWASCSVRETFLDGDTRLQVDFLDMSPIAQNMSLSIIGHTYFEQMDYALLFHAVHLPNSCKIQAISDF